MNLVVDEDFRKRSRIDTIVVVMIVTQRIVVKTRSSNDVDLPKLNLGSSLITVHFDFGILYYP